MGFWDNLFGKKKPPKKTTKEILVELTAGDLVFVRFKSPHEIGIVSGHELAFTRLNSQEIEVREVQGSVSRVWRDKDLRVMLLEVATYSSPAMPGQLRKMTFLEDEIEEVRKIDG